MRSHWHRQDTPKWTVVNDSLSSKRTTLFGLLCGIVVSDRKPVSNIAMSIADIL